MNHLDNCKYHVRKLLLKLADCVHISSPQGRRQKWTDIHTSQIFARALIFVFLKIGQHHSITLIMGMMIKQIPQLTSYYQSQYYDESIDLHGIIMADTERWYIKENTDIAVYFENCNFQT